MEDTAVPVHVGSMRISAPYLQFHDERSNGIGPGHTGWFVSANDAEVENQQALTIAAAFNAVPTEQLGQPMDVFTNSVQA